MDTRWDLLIRDALIFDGTGQPPRRGDIAVQSGRIARRGQRLDPERADRVIDADGLWLTPGLLDIHTHYDLEVELAPGLSESVRHGTTTVVVSNCSLGLAYGAQRRDGHDPIVDCFARVENVPKEVLSAVADRVTWDNPADYLDHLRQIPLGPNIAPMIPHSMLRIEVMGMEGSTQRDPTEAELAQMVDLLDEGMKLGYIGFSTDALPFHYLANDPNRRKKIPGQYCDFKELRLLTDVVRRYGRVWQATPPKDNPIDVLRTFMLSSGRLYGRPLKLTAVAALDIQTNRTLLALGRVLTDLLNSPLLQGQFALQSLAARFKVWAEGPITPLAEEIKVLRMLNEPDLEDRPARLALLNDPDWIADFKRMWRSGRPGTGAAHLKRRLRVEDHALSRQLDDMTIERCPVAPWQGETMAAVRARLLGWQRSGRQGARDPQEAQAFATFPDPAGDEADFFLHLLRQWDTDMVWSTISANKDPAVVKRLLFDTRFLPGFSDSGAHLTNMAFYDANLRALQIAAAESTDAVSFMVRRLTLDPARFFNLDAGTVDVGATADLTLIDPAALAAYDAEANVTRVTREAIGHEQLVNRSDGVVPLVLIGGKVAWQRGAPSDDLGRARMGRLLTAHVR